MVVDFRFIVHVCNIIQGMQDLKRPMISEHYW